MSAWVYVSWVFIAAGAVVGLLNTSRHDGWLAYVMNPIVGAMCGGLAFFVVCFPIHFIGQLWQVLR